MLSNMTSNFAGVPLAFAYIILLGNNGVFTLLFKQWGWSVFADFDLYSWSGLILVYVYFQVPLALLLLYPSFTEFVSSGERQRPYWGLGLGSSGRRLACLF